MFFGRCTLQPVWVVVVCMVGLRAHTPAAWMVFTDPQRSLSMLRPTKVILSRVRSVKRAPETWARRAPAGGEGEPGEEPATGSAGLPSERREGVPGYTRAPEPPAITRASPAIVARSPQAPPAAGMGLEKAHPRRMARRARERRTIARDEPPRVARRGCRR